jgi:2-polyprenyl-3-methyl-5-hydroxy-6-metoxy-1,4-benzoquinol methylase
MRVCWCGTGSKDLLAFSHEYSVCPNCGTLVSQQSLSDDQLIVQNDDIDFYGKQYWLDHQSQDLDFPDIHARARNDLTERNLHWLKTLLKYCLPPAKVMELGCSHGSFVALLSQAGYDASGVEMSPWVVEFGQKTFGVPISVGPVETLEIAPGSLDVIALMDVLEHLPDPAATMAHCLKLLKPDGLLLIQMPQFNEEMNYTTLVETKGAFLEQLKADEHLYLFSDRSVTRLFKQLGADYIQFEPAIFGYYDMFFAVSRAPLQTHTPDQVESALLSTPNGRLALALLDLRDREKESETDRAARGEQIAARGEQIETLTGMLKESEADRAARWTQIETLTKMLQESAADLHALFARPGFRLLNRFSSWPEVNKLANRFFGKPNE